MTMRNALLASALTMLPVGIAAAQPRDTEDNVVLIDVSNVRVPDALPGACSVRGVVGEVLDGPAFRKGQPISLKVPCGVHARAMPLMPAIADHTEQLIDPQVLVASKVGFAHLDDSGALIWQPTRRSYGRWGIAWGYRVLDGAMLPAAPERPSM